MHTFLKDPQNKNISSFDSKWLFLEVLKVSTDFADHSWLNSKIQEGMPKYCDALMFQLFRLGFKEVQKAITSKANVYNAKRFSFATSVQIQLLLHLFSFDTCSSKNNWGGKKKGTENY